MYVSFADHSPAQEYENEPLKSGAEGDIFLSKDRRHAVKIYPVKADPNQTREQINRITILIDELNPTRDPYWIEFFAWPEKLVVHPGIGFRMRYVGGMKTLDHYIFGKSFNCLLPEERGWFIGKVAAAIKLVSAANQLFKMGLSYPDFSHRNIMVDPFEGRMVLIDCDSLFVPGKLPATVQGTSWYRAPEIVRGQVREPAIKTDCHALAVILYMWFLTWHPLTGDKIFDPDDPDHDELLRYGEKPLYIEHPTDRSNAAKKQVFKASMLGPEMEKMFQHAFISGLQDPEKRPRAYEWLEALIHTYDRIIPCASHHCSWRFFVATPSNGGICPVCHERVRNIKTLPFMYLLRHSGRADPTDYTLDGTNAHYVVGWHGRLLHMWHIRPDASPSYVGAGKVHNATPMALFEYHQETWYLRNLALPDLSYREPGSKNWKPLKVDETLPLKTGQLLQFGDPPEHFRARIKLHSIG